MEAKATKTDQDLLSLGEAADFLNVSKPTMYRLLDQGKLTGMKAGKQWRFRRSDLVAYMERGPVALALANMPLEALEEELKFFATEEKPLDESPDDGLGAEEQMVTLLAERILRLAHSREASDVHFEPVFVDGKEQTRLRIRIDGVMHQIRLLPSGLHQPLILQLKKMAGMNLDERRLPQKGRIALKNRDSRVDFRVSTAPTIYGEELVCRSVPSSVPSIKDLGIADRYTSVFNKWMGRNTGLVLFTGPVGSGCVTLMHSCLAGTIKEQTKVISVEDPIEYLQEGVTYLQIDHSIGLSPANALRAALWQDPDFAVVSQIKDEEMASVVEQTARTGHIVVSSMQTDDAISAVYLLLKWGVGPSLLNGVSNQRLVRRLCNDCKKPANLPKETLQRLRERSAKGGFEIPADATFYSPVGCEKCHGVGYFGRLAIVELLDMTTEIVAAMERGVQQTELLSLAVQEGMRTVFAEGIARAVEGVTSVEEVVRVTPRSDSSEIWTMNQGLIVQNSTIKRA